MEKHISYPRTYHLPWSLGASEEDIVHETKTIHDMFSGRQVVVTEKLDGKNTTIYSDGHMHGREITDHSPDSQEGMKAIAKTLVGNLPDGWRVCGEDLSVEQSLNYEFRTTNFYVFAIYDEHNRCLSWPETVEWSGLLGLETVPVLYEGAWDSVLLQGWHESNITGMQYYMPSEFGPEGEGYVVRIKHAFWHKDFTRSVTQWSRPNT